MLVEPVKDAERVIVRQPVFPGPGFDYVAFHPTLGGVKGIVIAHELQVFGRHVTKSAIRFGHHDPRLGNRETNGLKEHIRAEQRPGERLGRAARGVVNG